MSIAVNLVRSVVAKSGGIDKCRSLLREWRRIGVDRDAVAEYVRRAVKTDAGARQMFALAMLGLTIAVHLTEREEPAA